MVIDVVDAAVLEEEWAVSAVGSGEVLADLTVAEVGNCQSEIATNKRNAKLSASGPFNYNCDQLSPAIAILHHPHEIERYTHFSRQVPLI
jgi:hypothetical protein